MVSNTLITKTSKSECVNHIKSNEVCSSPALINDIKRYIVKIDNNDPIEIIEKAKKLLNCDSESCILTKPELTKYIKSNTIQFELDTRFKASGPRDSVKLLNNINIDETLLIWGREFKHFYPCPFAMIDFDTNGNKLGYINLANLVTGKESYVDPIYGIQYGPFDIFACVLNTDISTGKGKHWICIVADMRELNWTIEFFNSSGNLPVAIITEWMETQRKYLLPYNANVETVVASNITHQTDNHSCGSYVLYYIRARLDKIPYTYFATNRIKDEDAVEFRTHLFRKH